MNKKWALALTIISMVFASFSSASDKVVLKYGELNPDGNTMTDSAREFAKLVDQKKWRTDCD